ncbi:MAG: MmgE/PrpD family protein [Pseudomonadota bacterium]
MALAVDVATELQKIRFDDLPPDVVGKIKLLILDHLGCMISGGATDHARTLRKVLTKGDDGGDVSVFGTETRMTAANAAHANAHAASAFSLDDSYVRFGHPGASIIPAAIAVAEERDASGTDLLTAIVAGYEMSLRLGAAIVATEPRDQQVKGLACWQIFGAAAALAKLHGFSAMQTADVFGLAAIHAPVPFIRKFHSKPMNRLKNNYGWANRGAITAAAFVEAGFHGNKEIFDGDSGFWVMAGSDRFDPDAMTNELGERFMVQDVGFKPYGVCRWIHTAIDCTRELMKSLGLNKDNLDVLHVETVEEFVRDFGGAWPQSTLEAIFHIPYALALELHGKSSSLGLRDEDLNDADLKRTGQKVTLAVLEGAAEAFYADARLPVRLTARRRDGTSRAVTAEWPTGQPKGPPFGRDEVVGKFFALALPVVGKDRAEALIAAVDVLDETNVRQTFQR